MYNKITVITDEVDRVINMNKLKYININFIEYNLCYVLLKIITQ